MQTAMVGSAESQCVARRAFVGLFQLAMDDEPGLRAALNQAGYSADSDREYYSSQIWRDALDAARAYQFGELPPEEGLRLLGHLFVQGFALTTVGRVLAQGAPWLGPERVLARLGSYMKTARTDVSVAITPLGVRHWRLTFQDPHPLGGFVVGCIERLLALCSVSSTPKLVEQTSGQYVIDVYWE